MSDFEKDLEDFLEAQERAKNNREKALASEKQRLQNFFKIVIEAFTEIKKTFEKKKIRVELNDLSDKSLFGEPEECLTVSLNIKIEQNFYYSIEAKKQPEFGYREVAYFSDSDGELYGYSLHSDDEQWYSINVTKKEIMDGFKEAFNAMNGFDKSMAFTKVFNKNSSTEQKEREKQHMPDRKKVFVVYGRNTKVYTAMKLFLQAVGLEALDFYKIKDDMGGSPFVGKIVQKGMEQAQAVVVLYTPDEYASLHPNLTSQHDSDEDKNRWQPRANVILEAGMALAISEDRTILIVFGNADLPSDLHGRHYLRLDNSTNSRNKLRNLLKGQGVNCEVDPQKDEWHDLTVAGDFEECFKAPVLPEVSTQSPFRS